MVYKHKNSRRLNDLEKKQFQEQGYVKNLPVFSKYGVNINLNKFMNNVSLGSVPRPNTTLFIQYRV